MNLAFEYLVSSKRKRNFPARYKSLVKENASSSLSPLLLITGTAAIAIFFTSIHSVIYNWCFLPSYMRQHGWTPFITREIVEAYWNWAPARILISLNLLLVVLPFLILFGLNRIRSK